MSAPHHTTPPSFGLGCDPRASNKPLLLRPVGMGRSVSGRKHGNGAGPVQSRKAGQPIQEFVRPSQRLHERAVRSASPSLSDGPTNPGAAGNPRSSLIGHLGAASVAPLFRGMT